MTYCTILFKELVYDVIKLTDTKRKDFIDAVIPKAQKAQLNIKKTTKKKLLKITV